MGQILTAFAVAIVVWWLATGLVALAVRVRDDLRGRVLGGAGIVALAGLGAIIWSSGEMSVLSAYVGFAGALCIWAFHETAFLLGLVTGSRPVAAPRSLFGWQRFLAAFRAIDHHEISVFLTLLAMGWFFASAANPMAFWTFALMWVMRTSTKLIIFFGAPNAVSDLMPKRIRYLTSHFCTDRITPIFSLALALSFGLLIVLIDVIARSEIPFMAVGHTLLAAFVLLAMAEHLFLVIPFRDSALWTWATNGQDSKSQAVSAQPNGDFYAAREKSDVERIDVVQIGKNEGISSHFSAVKRSALPENGL
jgi:putative photosynthetic complex assembly protein 2